MFETLDAKTANALMDMMAKEFRRTVQLAVEREIAAP